VRAAVATDTGGPDVLSVGDVADPHPAPGEVVVEVVATAVNRADTLQRQGFYPPPPGTPVTLGLVCSGRSAELGDGVT
jgi:NADPH:quinone reductase-like Zn-dependent oxidoreductase